MGAAIEAGNITGLSEKDALLRLEEDGYNEIPSAKKRGFLDIAFEILKEPMFLLLIACGSLYFFLGDKEEAMILLMFVFVVIGITLYQENKTERAIDALRDLSSPMALVIRDGQKKRIPGREVVKGDAMLLSEGDRVPADAVLVSSTNLLADESLLTGESVPVRKAEAQEIIEMGLPGGDDLPFVYSGTLIVRGRGIAIVKATGFFTEIGKIGKSLHQIETEKSQLQKETQDIVKNVTIAGAILCTLVVLVYGTTRGNWLEGFLSGLTLAMSILPEEFPVVLTIFLALGAWRMSRKRVLTRRQHAIHSLGSATVLCVDKTGTITENRMSLKTIYSKGKSFNAGSKKELPEHFHELVEFGILSSQKDPVDPMEKALRELSLKFLAGTEHVHHDWHTLREYPLSRQLLAVSHVWKAPRKEEYVIAAKGAPESIWELCHLKEKQITELAEKVGEMAEDGLRVIGVAKASMKKNPLPDQQHDFDFEFLGLLGFEDPVRGNVAGAVSEAYTAGIRVIMITGDYPGTAKNVAKQIGLLSKEGIITGPELNGMDDAELRKRISETNIFARVVPEQKLRIVNALKENDEIVAMTGDGVNDAPALKSAHIGLAMGGRGTDVAREASSVVILDDDFSSIVHGVRLGRHIFDNIRKAMTYILAVHIPIAGITFLSVLLGWPLILLPVHIVFLELVIDPSCSVVFERELEEANIMKRPPRSTKERIFNKKTIKLSVLQGLGVLLMVAAVFQLSIGAGNPENDARALAFSVLIISNLALIFANRFWNRNFFSTLFSRNDAFWVVAVGALAFLTATLYVPFLQGIFKFGFLGPDDICIILACGALSTLWFEALKITLNKGRD
jgi:Ca2+-transporting ATPase